MTPRRTRIFARVFLFSATTFVLLGLVACSDSGSPTGIVHQAGYSYDPANSGNFPVPVWWQNDEPTVLPTLKGNCSFNTGGRAEAITASGSDIYIAGFSTVCNDDGNTWAMVPAVWLNGTRTDLKHGAPQAEATSIAVANGNVYVGGGAGAGSPIPVLWTNGVEADLPMPSHADSGLVTKVVALGSDVYASGFVHGETTHAFTPGYWKNGVYTEIPLGNSSYEVTSPVSIAVSGTAVLTGVNIYTGNPNLQKAALWQSGPILPLTDLNFDTAPWSGVDAFLYDGTTSLAAGFITNGNLGFPAPVYWKGTSPTSLSVLDNNINGGSIGEAYGLVSDGINLYISGYTSQHADSNTVVAVPCYWVNGQRHDRKAIASSSSYDSVAVPTKSPVGWTGFPTELDFGNNQRISGSLLFTQTVANSGAAKGIVIVH